MIINFNKTKFNKKYIEKITLGFEYAVNLLKIPCKDLEVNVDFVSKSRIKWLNTEFRDKTKPTDVLSFPNLLEMHRTDMQLITTKLTKSNFKKDINPETNCIMLGDICICKAVAFKHAREYRTTKIREVVYIAVHGFLHLLGYDHMIETDKKIMRNVEEKIMKKISLGRKK